MMQIYLNGELTHTACSTLLELIEELALDGKRFAVEKNEALLSSLNKISTAKQLDFSNLND